MAGLQGHNAAKAGSGQVGFQRVTAGKTNTPALRHLELVRSGQAPDSLAPNFISDLYAAFMARHEMALPADMDEWGWIDGYVIDGPRYQGVVEPSEDRFVATISVDPVAGKPETLAGMRLFDDVDSARAWVRAETIHWESAYRAENAA